MPRLSDTLCCRYSFPGPVKHYYSGCCFQLHYACQCHTECFALSIPDYSHFSQLHKRRWLLQLPTKLRWLLMDSSEDGSSGTSQTCLIENSDLDSVTIETSDACISSLANWQLVASSSQTVFHSVIVAQFASITLNKLSMTLSKLTSKVWTAIWAVSTYSTQDPS